MTVIHDRPDLPEPASPRSAPGGDRQLLQYASELQQLREREQLAQRQVSALQRTLAQAQAQQLAITKDFKQVHAAERERVRELEDLYLATIRALAIAVEARDGYTGGHLERVRKFSEAIGRRVGLDHAALHQLNMSAILHDLGKIGIADAVLQKPGKLDAQEWLLMRQHAVIGANILRTVPRLAANAEALEHHHEMWDGTGYPGGLKGEAIPLASRIICVADTFDAMTSTRAYRRAPGIGAAVAEITRCAGTQFDPAVVKAFLQAWEAREIP